jgi:hypothetical protein
VQHATDGNAITQGTDERPRKPRHDGSSMFNLKFILVTVEITQHHVQCDTRIYLVPITTDDGKLFNFCWDFYEGAVGSLMQLDYPSSVFFLRQNNWRQMECIFGVIGEGYE